MIAIIPARGGSKGLPNKNIKLLNGLPLIAYTINSARESTCIDRIIVSTEDNVIAEVAKELGAEVPFRRPPSLAQDDSIAIDTYVFTINKLEELEDNEIDAVCVLLPTCPLRSAVDIDNAYTIFVANDADSVISYTQEAHPIFWHKFINENGQFINIFDENTLKNRQEHRLSYFPNGAIFVFKTDLLRKGAYYSEKSFAYIMPRERSVDIDTAIDFKYAEFLLNLKSR